jgi:hypothetical protein
VFDPTTYPFKILTVLSLSKVSYAFFRSMKMKYSGVVVLFTNCICSFDLVIAVLVSLLLQNPCTAW